MANLKESYQKYNNNKLLEARTVLLENGIYPFEVFLKEHSETIHASEQILKLEELAESYKNKLPTMFLLTKQSTAVLLETNDDTDAIKSVMINYAFLSEALRVFVKETANILKSKQDPSKSPRSLYGTDSVELFEFSIKKASSYKLLDEGADEVVKNFARELTTLTVNEIITLCEKAPAIKLYVANSVHRELANHLIRD